jgi:uncharacterized glyoxalase superfamily protein PhnB/2'-5' RNA ligase
MQQQLALVTLVVPDYDQAIAHYVGDLGFTLAQDTPQPEPGKRWVVVRPPGARSSGCALLLARATSDAQRACIGRQTGGRVGFFLHTRDLAADLARLQARGVRIERPPRQEPYGHVLVFADAFGNLWDLIQPSPSAPAPQGPLFTVAFPELAPAGAAFVAANRGPHALGVDIAPHVTLQFGSAGLAPDAVARHVAAVAARQAPRAFVCRHAMPWFDPHDGLAHVFLVPDEGHAALAALHDALHTGPLEAARATDRPFVPHLTLASHTRADAAVAQCRQLNAAGVHVAATVRSLCVGRIVGPVLGPVLGQEVQRRFETLSQHPLAAP